MSIEMLTTAARAAGFAMAPSDDLVAEPRRREADHRAPTQPSLTTAVVQVSPAAPQPSVWSFWKTA
jgi:hypothetical protein